MTKITREDIQCIGDEDTLLHFLEEKLNLPIPEGYSLKDITINYANFALGLSGTVANQVLDCQEFSVSPGESSGIILIRFNNESGYAEALRAIAKGLDGQKRRVAELRFICMNEYFQPFAIAYFKNWPTAVLNILAWTQENTHIHTSSEHEIPTALFSKDEGRDVPYGEKDEPPSDEQKETKETSASEGYGATQQRHRSKPTSPETLLAKLRKTGGPLSRYGNLHIGIVPGHTAFLIDECTRDQFVNEDPDSIELIKPLLKPRKWKGELGCLICIPRHWTGKDESTAEQIFAETYPEISKHMSSHIDKLKERSAYKSRYATAEFYWDLPAYNFYADLKRPKIFWPPTTSSMSAAYDDSGKLLTSAAFFSTEDLSLLAILNSNLFAWYAHRKYWNEALKRLKLNIGNMQKAPIADRREEQKAELTELVQRILNDPDSFEVADTKWKIDQLIYELYELTPMEINLIEEESSQ
ncbi:hypothetical protein F4X88_03735 [Candidatus Poribacteria bacterium]|nr:hypothetical protein [Candidatus Poribacteria bacterium]